MQEELGTCVLCKQESNIFGQNEKKSNWLERIETVKIIDFLKFCRNKYFLKNVIK